MLFGGFGGSKKNVLNPLNKKRLSKGPTTLLSGDLQSKTASKRDASEELLGSKSELSPVPAAINEGKEADDRSQPQSATKVPIKIPVEKKPEAQGINLHMDAMGEFKKNQQLETIKNRMTVKKVAVDKQSKFQDHSPQRKAALKLPNNVLANLNTIEGMNEISQVRKFV
mmetsp:Transcript_27678/g.41967  ORF Transcript_27678/g.41967 Transcript_27678/m.41967 type:complete len:169 (+) Transcript_27678:58-564(+)